MCQQFVWCILYTPKYQADASLPKCEEVEGEGFGEGMFLGGLLRGGGAKISALSLNRGGSREGV